MFLFTFLLLFASILLINGQDTNKHMICKEVSNVFNNNNGDSQLSARRLQGPMGKRGQPGLKGETGPSGASGQPGTVDYERVAELVRIEVAKETETKMKNLEEKLMNASTIIEGTIVREQEQCESGVRVDQKCFITEIHSTSNISLAEAEQICRNKGSRLADISTGREHNAIMELVRNKMPAGRSDAHAWTGMQRDKNGNAVLSNGQISVYKRIREMSNQWSTAEARRTHVYIFFRKNPNDADQGLGSIWPSFKLFGVVCSV